jgi:phage portal protein, SPP1 gp6-like
MFNRARLSDKYGRSDLRELTSVIDAASRTLTNLQVAQEVASSPLRAVVGDGASDMISQYPEKMQAYMGNLIAIPSGGDVKQLTGMALDPFINTYRSYALQLSAMTGIPPSMMGVSSDNNPTSAEALRVAKDRLIARAENKQRQFSDALERVGRIVAQANGMPLDGLEALEVTWRDAAAPSTSAQMANALQAHSQGIIGDETAREFLHLTPEQLRREKARGDKMDAEAGLDMPEAPEAPEDVEEDPKSE